MNELPIEASGTAARLASRGRQVTARRNRRRRRVLAAAAVFIAMLPVAVAAVWVSEMLRGDREGTVWADSIGRSWFVHVSHGAAPEDVARDLRAWSAAQGAGLEVVQRRGPHPGLITVDGAGPSSVADTAVVAGGEVVIVWSTAGPVAAATIGAAACDMAGGTVAEARSLAGGHPLEVVDVLSGAPLGDEGATVILVRELVDGSLRVYATTDRAMAPLPCDQLVQ